MARHWSFGKKLGAGFAVTVALAVAIGAIAVFSLRSVVAAKDQVIEGNKALLVGAHKLDAFTERRRAAVRGFLIARDERFVVELQGARREFADTLERLRGDVGLGDENRRLLDDIARADAAYQQAADEIVALRRTDAPLEAVVKAFDEKLTPRRQDVDAVVEHLVTAETRRLEAATHASGDAASSAIALVSTIAAVAIIVASGVAIFLTRALNRHIGTAVGQVQSSSAELQAAANQQASASTEQATAMNEITTTINELLVTSRQIADSARRVAQMADQTAEAAKNGEMTVHRGNESMAGIRRQVDLIVSHMLDLGKKSQQIGAVLDIVVELAEQTNILAINATIEAAGAGEAGKRFGVVADEIRKLADRVGAATKEIRVLIDAIRSAVNTTVMTTETGSKAVDAGTKQFAEVAAAFKQIVDLVLTTTEASREIELSTKQQTTAVEQVNVAIANVAQAARESEASSTQTLQTASQLASLSRELHRVIEPEAA